MKELESPVRRISQIFVTTHPLSRVFSQEGDKMAHLILLWKGMFLLKITFTYLLTFRLYSCRLLIMTATLSKVFLNVSARNNALETGINFQHENLAFFEKLLFGTEKKCFELFHKKSMALVWKVCSVLIVFDLGLERFWRPTFDFSFSRHLQATFVLRFNAKQFENRRKYESDRSRIHWKTGILMTTRCY